MRRVTRTLNIVELYAGIGRCSAPFRAWSRGRVGLLADWNEHAARTYVANHPDADYHVGDLLTASVHDLEAASDGKIDIVLGCPPCQGFSDSGARDPNDPRNDHVLNFFRLALGARPLAIAMENVPLAAVSQQFERATRALESAGYRWTADVLNAAQFGSAQTRHRLVLVAVRSDVGTAPELPAPTHATNGRYFDYAAGRLRDVDGDEADLLGTTAVAQRIRARLRSRTGPAANRCAPTPTFAAAVDGLPKAGGPAGRRIQHTPWHHSAALLRRMGRVPEGGQDEAGRYYNSAYGRLHRRGLCRTLTTYFSNAGSGRFWHPTENRAITLREAARLQGVPDSFQFLEAPARANTTLLGNTLDAALASATFRAVEAALG